MTDRLYLVEFAPEEGSPLERSLMVAQCAGAAGPGAAQPPAASAMSRAERAAARDRTSPAKPAPPSRWSRSLEIGDFWTC